MNPSDMYHLMGIREQECTCAKYSGSVAVLYVRTKKNEFYCAKCGSRHVYRFNLEVQHRCAKIARIFVSGKKSPNIFWVEG